MRRLLCAVVVLASACSLATEGEEVGVASSSSEGEVVVSSLAIAQQTYLKPFNHGLSFGAEIAADGDAIVVGAPLEQSRREVPGDHTGVDNGAAYVVFHEATHWVQRRRDYLKSSPILDTARFGQRVAIDGDTVAVGEQFGTGAVHVFQRSGTAWVRTAILRPFVEDAFRRFGLGLALSGDTLVVGDGGDPSNATGVGGDPNNTDAPFSGAVYVYTREGTSWTLEAYIKASNTEEGDGFGRSVALSGDTLAVGSIDDSSATGVDGDQMNNDSPESGSVFVFERGPDGWAQRAYLKASNTGVMDSFSSELSLAGDTLAVSAIGEDSAATGVDGDQSSDAARDSGAVYVFTRDGASWSQQAYVKASNTAPFDRFGSIALTGDRLAVGAFGEASEATGIDGDQANDAAPSAGAVYLFERDSGSWAQSHYIKASNTDAADFFGWAVAWAGQHLLVGAPGEDSCATRENGDQFDDECRETGAVYIHLVE